MGMQFDKYFIQGRSGNEAVVIAGLRSGNELAEKVYNLYSSRSADPVIFLDNIDETFSDHEIKVRLNESVNGKDVFLFQSFFNPQQDNSTNDNIMSFLIAVRAFREHGARSITGVASYLSYARQDKPSDYQREPTTSRMLSDLMTAAGLDRLICLQPHTPQIHGFFGATRLTSISSVPIWSNVFEQYRNSEETIIVAPDIGAAKVVQYIAKNLEVSMAVASKFRPSKEKVEIMEISGDFTGKKRAIIVDYMISTGSTIYEVARQR